MMRQKYLVELSAPDLDVNADASREAKIAALEESSQRAKKAIGPLLERCRSVDPEIKITAADTIFPILLIFTTDNVIRVLEDSEFVKKVGPAGEFAIQ